MKKLKLKDKFGPIAEKIFSQISPLEILKVVFTPENMEALGRGIAEGAVKGAKDK